MAAHTSTLDDLLQRLEAGTGTVIFPSQRAAAMGRRAFDRRQRAHGRLAWKQPLVLSWSQWMQSLWTAVLLEGHDDRMLLNRAQERLLWRDVIRTDAATDAMTPETALASMAQSALARLGRYSAFGRMRVSETWSPDTQAFARWAEEFARRCERGRWLSPSLLEAELLRHVGDGNVQLPSAVEIVGFPTIEPARQKLLESMDAHGTLVDVTTLKATSAERRRIDAADLGDEMQLAARWLRAKLEENPDAEFALIAPDSFDDMQALEAALRVELAPERLHAGADPGDLPWDGPTKTPLSAIGSVAALLDVIAWMRSSLPMDRISGVLLCALFSGGPLEQRARFDAAVVQRETLLRPELDLRSILRLARLDERAELADWLSALAAESDRLAMLPPRQPFATWMAAFGKIAGASGWTPNENTHPADARLIESVQAIFDLAATLDFAGQRVTFAEALEAVRTLCAETPAWTSSNVRLHIVPLAEAAGLPSDGALFLDASEENLYPRSRIHTLLDWQLQRAAHMPGTDAEADERDAAEAVRRVVSASRFLCFSHAAEDRSARAQMAGLASDLGCEPYQPAASLDLSAAGDEDLLEFSRESAPPPPLPSNRVRGGARVLELQATCAFQAFAEVRLGGRRLNAPSAGLDAAESGNVLHRVLDAFWSNLETQKVLQAMTLPEREAAVAAAVDEGISSRLRLRDEWDRQYIDIQKQRIRNVLRRWLDLELDRKPFTVQARESKASVLVGPLELDVRLDRLDRLEDGGLVFIDYKTGASASSATWEGERPDQPQLPLYTLLAEPEELRGLAFARIRAGTSMQWAGWVAEEGILPRRGSAIRELAADVTAWRSVLEALAESFAAGVHTVAPKSYAKSCTRCAQRLLCRLDVEALGDEEEESEDVDA